MLRRHLLGLVGLAPVAAALPAAASTTARNRTVMPGFHIDTQTLRGTSVAGRISSSDRRMTVDLGAGVIEWR